MQHVGTVARVLLTVVAVGSTVAAKLSPELGIEEALQVPFDVVASTNEWARVAPWAWLGLSGFAVRYLAAAYNFCKVAAHWTRPRTAVAMELVYWVLADITARGVDALPDNLGHPECPDGKSYCTKIFSMHATFAVLAVLSWISPADAKAAGKVD